MESAIAMRSTLPLSLVLQARRHAVDHLIAAGRAQDARIIDNGGGDDFVEVQVALRAVSESARLIARLERALGTYADESFWDADCPDHALAVHDRGEIARAALAGRELFETHRD